jgi:hypothetical protein
MKLYGLGTLVAGTPALSTLHTQALGTTISPKSSNTIISGATTSISRSAVVGRWMIQRSIHTRRSR